MSALPPPAPKRHPHFYFPDGSVTFQVEGVLYRVYRHPFERHSGVFETMFSLPPGRAVAAEGQADAHPIRLDGVRSADFEALLSVLCPHDPAGYGAQSTAQWKAILALASRWEFDALQAVAVRHLADTLSPVEKIVYAQRYELREWLRPAYAGVCARAEPLSADEVRQMGADDVAKIAAIRENVQASGCVAARRQTLVETLVEQRFGLEISESSRRALMMGWNLAWE